MNLRFACIVEGDGEATAIEVLINRLLRDLDPELSAKVRVIRQSRGTILKEVESLTEAAVRIIGRGAILLLIDSDDDCPKDLGPGLLARMHAARSDIPCGVVIAEREYESWFIAAAPSLAGICGLRPHIALPGNLQVRDPKGWLTQQMARGIYKETTHQRELTRGFDIQAARENSRSFDKCYREIHRLAVKLIQAA